MKQDMRPRPFRGPACWDWQARCGDWATRSFRARSWRGDVHPDLRAVPATPTLRLLGLTVQAGDLAAAIQRMENAYQGEHPKELNAAESESMARVWKQAGNMEKPRQWAKRSYDAVVGTAASREAVAMQQGAAIAQQQSKAEVERSRAAARRAELQRRLEVARRRGDAERVARLEGMLSRP